MRQNETVLNNLYRYLFIFSLEKMALNIESLSIHFLTRLFML